MKVPTIFLLAFLLISTSCVFVNKSILRENPTGKVFPTSQVQVFFENDNIPENIRVAIMTGKGSDVYTNESQMIDKLREEAGKLGANAIVLKGMKDPGAGEKFVASFFGTYNTQRKGDAIAIYIPALDPNMEMEQHTSYNEGLNLISTTPRARSGPQKIERTEDKIIPEKAVVEADKREEPAANEPASQPPPTEKTTRLPNLRKAAPTLDKYTDEQIIDAYRKRYPELKTASDDMVIAIMESRYAR